MGNRYTSYQSYESPRRSMSAAVAGDLTPTPADIEGPFYLPGAPFLVNGLLSAGSPVLTVSGKVLDTNGRVPLNAVLDIWQADEHGVYDEKGFNFRGKVNVQRSRNNEEDGSYYFRTVVPGDYKISDPGQPDDFRCAHIHVKVTAAGCKPLTTQLYFPDDPYNKTDHWFDTRRVIQKPAGIFNFVLEVIL